MKRRDFIKLSLLGAGAFGLNVYSDPLFAMAGNPRKKMVFIFLKGGADVLSLFPPEVPSNLRETILDSAAYNKNLRIHPSLGLNDSIKKNLMIFTHTGVKRATSSRSHFVQIEQLEKGYGSSGYFSQQIGGTSLRGIAIGSQVPKSFLGADVPLISSLGDINKGFDLGKVRTTRKERLEFFNGSKNEILNDIVPKAIANYEAIEKGYSDETITGTNFVSACQTAAELTHAPKDGSFEPSIITIDFGGWDDHFNLEPNNKNSAFSLRAKTLNDGLIALNDGMSSNTVIVIMTEFGRTIRFNSSKGADHGVGSAMMVIGNDVNSIFKGHQFKQEWDFSLTDKSGAGISSEAFKVQHDCLDVLDQIINKHVKT